MQDIYYFMISYAIIIFGGMFLFNWLSNGYFLKFIRVKASRGHKILVWERGRTQYDFYIGKILEGMLVFRDAAAIADGKDSFKRISIPPRGLFRAAGVVNCIYDPEKNAILETNLVGVRGFDPIKWAALLTRAEKKPATQDNNLILIACLILNIILVLGVVVLFVKLGKIEAAVNALGQISNNAVGVVP